GAGDSRQSGENSARRRELGDAASHPKHPQGKQNRDEKISDSHAQEAGVGAFQLFAALRDQRHVDTPAQTGQHDKHQPDLGCGIHQSFSSRKKTLHYSRRKAGTSGARSVAATAAVSATKPTMSTAANSPAISSQGSRLPAPAK